MIDLEIATRELRAARAIVLDPTCDDDLAAGHLLRAWQALARVAGRDLADGPAALLTAAERERLSARDLADAELVVPALLAHTSTTTSANTSADAELVVPAVLAHTPTTAPADPPAWTVPRPALERHCDVLARLLAARYTPPPRARARARARRLAFGTAAVAAVILAVRPWQSTSLGPWAAVYYNRPDFTGATVERRDLDVNFDWQQNPPMDAIPADRYSVRWDSCLTVDDAQEVTFQLVSDDSSRLAVDGQPAIDNWGRHELTARGRALWLAAGVHHLRVEYAEHRGDAAVALSASFGRERPGPIPGAMLHAPPGDDADADPCQPD